jgi:hypothetical protein
MEVKQLGQPAHSPWVGAVVTRDPGRQQTAAGTGAERAQSGHKPRASAALRGADQFIVRTA